MELMEIKEINYQNKKVWENFVNHHPFGHLLQSWEWGEVLLKDKHQIKRFSLWNGGNILISALVMKIPLPLGQSYFYIPRGPVLDWSKIISDEKYQNAFKFILKGINLWGRKEKALFLRIDPEIPFQDAYLNFLKKLGFRKSKKEPQPQRTIFLDLKKSPEELLKNMKSKTRYNIRLAQRKGIRIKEIKDETGIDIFYRLMLETSKRDKFYAHPKSHYQNLIKILGPKGLAEILVAEYNNQPLAANIVSFFNQKSTYLHGASSNIYRNLMPTYLLQWFAILKAQKRNCLIYDFGGIAAEDEKNHSWAGITRFKKGFGGEEKRFIGAWDLPYCFFKYQIFSNLNNLRRKIKGIS